jgi:hypothetical protein
LTSEQRRKELKHQTYLTNKEKRSATNINKDRKTYSTRKEEQKKTNEDLQGWGWT